MQVFANGVHFSQLGSSTVGRSNLYTTFSVILILTILESPKQSANRSDPATIDACMKYLEKLQTLLPVGYLYLILMGLLKEGILYYQLGINILNYSSITDILISPIVEIFKDVKLPIAIAISVVFFFCLQVFFIKMRDTKWARNLLVQNGVKPAASKQEVQKAILPFFILLVAIELLSMFVGIGIADSQKIVKKIKNKDFTTNYKVNFSSGRAEELYVFDMNSSYLFYLTKANPNIQIAPVATVSTLEVINNKRLQN
jgi:hypothetical protein